MRKLLITIGFLGVLAAAACTLTDHCAAAIALGCVGGFGLVVAADGEPAGRPTGR